MIKPNAKKGYSRNLAYFRMESVAAQNKILQQNLHNIGGQEARKIEYKIKLLQRFPP